jgi:alkylation response protein AidB-like acyl-CoA dehydrogenase
MLLTERTTNGRILENVAELAEGFSRQRPERQRRRHLDPADFERIRETGYLLTCVPEAYGGTWQSVEKSLRPVCEMLRTLAQGDASVALVSAMHPSVLGNWLCPAPVPADRQAAWQAQCDEIFGGVKAGAQWGTITSEPGSGGDIGKTAAGATPNAHGNYRLSGKKHFGSGSGVLTYMLTTAVPAGESAPDMFYLDYKGHPWDGSTGVQLVAEWEAHGMAATQSHSLEFTAFPARRIAWSGPFDPNKLSHVIGPCTFMAVITGIVEVAHRTAREQLAGRPALRPFEKVEFSRASHEAWLLGKAYGGILADVEAGHPHTVHYAKASVAELAESILTRLCRVIGGSTISRHSPYGYWAQDVKALGFLRPPWALAYDVLHEEALGRKEFTSS